MFDNYSQNNREELTKIANFQIFISFLVLFPSFFFILSSLFMYFTYLNPFVLSILRTYICTYLLSYLCTLLTYLLNYLPLT